MGAHCYSFTLARTLYSTAILGYICRLLSGLVLHSQKALSLGFNADMEYGTTGTTEQQSNFY